MLDLLNLLLPRRCVLCDRSGTGLCLSCLVRLPPAPDLAPPPGFTDFASLLSYEDDTRTLVASVKYHSRRDAIDLPARVLAQLIDWPVDRVTWAPTSAQRRRRRGYDQAELIARAVADELGVPCATSLSRESGRGHQTGRSRVERLEGPVFHYTGARATVGDGRTTVRRGRATIRGVRATVGNGAVTVGDGHAVLVIDDIRTTGATLCAAGDALLEGGVSTVSAATIAVTP